MADGSLRFIVSFDADTGALSVVKEQLEGVGDAASKSSSGLSSMGAGLADIAKVVAGVNIAQFLLQAGERALTASSAVGGLKDEFYNLLGAVGQSLDGVLKPISNGLQGLLILAEGVIKVIGDLAGSFTQMMMTLGHVLVGNKQEALDAAAEMKRDFAKIADDTANAIDQAGDRARGKTIAHSKEMAQEVLLDLRERLQNERHTGEERLLIIDAEEKRAEGIVKSSNEFKQADVRAQGEMLVQVDKQFTRLRAAAASAARKEEEDADAAHVAQHLKAIQDGLRQELADRFKSDAEKQALIGQAFSNEYAYISSQLASGKISHKQYEDALTTIVRDGMTSREALAKKEADDEYNLWLNAQKAKLSVEQKFGQSIIKLSEDIAGGKKETLRQALADEVRIVAEAAASEIMAHAMVAAAADLAKPGGFALAAADVAWGVAEASAVAALGGAASSAISAGAAPPSGSSSGGGGSTSPNYSSPTNPIAAGPAPSSGTTLGGSGGSQVIINVSGSEILASDRTAAAVAEAVARYSAS